MATPKLYTVRGSLDGLGAPPRCEDAADADLVIQASDLDADPAVQALGLALNDHFTSPPMRPMHVAKAKAHSPMGSFLALASPATPTPTPDRGPPVGAAKQTKST